MFISAEQRRQFNIKYPYIDVKLDGCKNNKLAIINRVCRSLNEHSVSPTEVLTYKQTALEAQRVEDVLAITMKWVEIS